uniref:Uncharacterized protein n=1 Tax=Oryza punctata TaxID=4537 RepID=A0A0E0JF80_ORYPU
MLPRCDVNGGRERRWCWRGGEGREKERATSACKIMGRRELLDEGETTRDVVACDSSSTVTKVGGGAFEEDVATREESVPVVTDELRKYAPHFRATMSLLQWCKNTQN